METTRPSLRVRDHRDDQAWAEFDSIYRPLLHRFVSRCGLGQADAEDVVQHCMASIGSHIRSFDYDPRKGRFKGWLRTLVNNRVRNHWRNRREQIGETKDFRIAQEREPEPEEVFDRIWMQEHLKHCLQQLRAEMQPATVAAYERYVLQEREAEEVCKEFDLTREQLYRIKWRLTQKLSDMMTVLLDGIE